MPRTPTREVSEEYLTSLFKRLDIWGMIDNGQLTSHVVVQKASSHWPNSTSEIIKHFTKKGKHVVTTHRVRGNNNDKIFHWDAKDIRINIVHEDTNGIRINEECWWRK